MNAMLRKEDLHEDFVQIVNNAIQELGLVWDDIISIIGSGKKVTSSVISKDTGKQISLNENKGIYQFTENTTEKFLLINSSEDLVFDLVSHALSGFLYSISRGYNSNYKCLFKNDFYNNDALINYIEYIEKINTNVFDFHPRQIHCSILDFNWLSEYPYITCESDIEKLFIMKLAYFVRRYKVVIEVSE